MILTQNFDHLIDQYRIEKKIKQKTFTDCYLAFDVEGNLPVSLEILQSTFMDDMGVVSQFKNRSLALTQIRHPNLAHVIKTGNSVDNSPYIVSEYIEGYPLTERLKQLERQQSPAHSIYALKLVQQITSALILAERQGILHYELTPDHILLKNVTLKSDDTVVVIDLGAPLIEQSINREKMSDQASFLSPEQLDGKKIDGRSHIFSLGAILYALLAGKVNPGEPVSFRHKTIRQAARGKTALELSRENLAPETYALVDTCLQRNPTRRYRDLLQFSEALTTALIAEEKNVYLVQEPKPARRPWPFMLTILLLIAVCLGFGALAASNLPAMIFGTSAVAAPPIEPAAEGLAAVNLASKTPTATATLSPTVNATTVEKAVTAPQASATATQPPTNTATPASTETAVATTTFTPTPWPSYRIISSSASIRSGPGVIYPAIGYVYEGEIISILAKSQNIPSWFNIETDAGLVGWISSTVGEPHTAYNPDDIEFAATIPAPPPPTATPTPTNTPIPTATTVGNNGGGGDDGNDGNPEPPRPTPTPPL